MASTLGGGGGDPKQRLGDAAVDHSRQQQHPFEYFEHMQNGSVSSAGSSDSPTKHKHYYEHDDDDEWQSSSSPASSTRQMLSGGQHQHHTNGNNKGSSSSSSGTRRRGLTTPVVVASVVKKIDWASLWGKSKEWMRSPMNMALLAWVVAVAVSGAILFMVMTGMLNRVLTTKPQKDTWFEVNNQILNALFTLMCLCQHPRRVYHLALLCRWRAGDMLRLRQAYCKDGTCKPNERKHMAVVLLLLHLNCLAQYALCGLNLGYRRPQRPVLGVALTISVAICAPAVAGLYSNLSPLGNDYEAQPAPAPADEESANPQLQRKTTTLQHQHGVGWAGGLFDMLDDISLAYLSVFCSCCVFGWNASRLGFGNMYVHVATFVLLCLAPFFIFDLAAINIDSEAARDALGLAGIFLCVLGLLYGGFWRIHMRRRFRLPPSHACCGRPDLTDCMHWLCCYSCALAQEVRTADALLLRVEEEDPIRIPSISSSPDRTAPFGFAAGPGAFPVSVNDGVTVPPPLSVILRTTST